MSLISGKKPRRFIMLILDSYDVGPDVQEWCKENNASHYKAPKEEFTLAKAIKLAKEEGKDIVVTEIIWGQ
jgi:hypothetical protein